MDAEIQKDIEFALMVNEQVKSDPAAYRGVVTNHEPIRQFIMECGMMGMSPAEWFDPADAVRKNWQEIIRADRVRYEAVQEEKQEQQDNQNEVQQQLAQLQAAVDKLLAEKEAPAEPEAEPEAEPATEKPTEDDEQPEDEEPAEEA